jgi:hypothetical protein
VRKIRNKRQWKLCSHIKIPMSKTWAASNRQKCQAASSQKRHSEVKPHLVIEVSCSGPHKQLLLQSIMLIRFTSQISTCPLNSVGALSNYDNDLQVTETSNEVSNKGRKELVQHMLRAQSALLRRFTSQVIFYSTFFYFVISSLTELQCSFLICHFQLVSVKADNCFSFQ